MNNDEPLVKLIDYHLETTFNHQKIIKNRYGSIYFTAPEVIDDSHDQDCIMWNCGILMYLLLLGDLPFDGASINHVRK
jgi:serine/threonine protein kinase